MLNYTFSLGQAFGIRPSCTQDVFRVSEAMCQRLFFEAAMYPCSLSGHDGTATNVVRGCIITEIDTHVLDDSKRPKFVSWKPHDLASHSPYYRVTPMWYTAPTAPYFAAPTEYKKPSKDKRPKMVRQFDPTKAACKNLKFHWESEASFPDAHSIFETFTNYTLEGWYIYLVPRGIHGIRDAEGCANKSSCT